MGLRMEIHNPSVPSTSSEHAQTDGPASRDSVMELIRRKDGLEAELDALGEVLVSHGVNMNTSLTTFDGYPRDDIDVAQSWSFGGLLQLTANIAKVRTTRARIIHLRNDHKALMKSIEKGLHEIHAGHLASAQNTTATEGPASSATGPSSRSQSSNQRNALPETIFARVNSVVLNSPADQAGLKAGDGIVRFGDVDFMNHANLSRVSALVKASQGKEVTVKIRRSDAASDAAGLLELVLTPHSRWGGKGLLGCHLLPV